MLIHVPIYSRNVLVLLGYSIESACHELERNWEDCGEFIRMLKQESSTTLGLVLGHNGTFLLWIKQMIDTVDTYAALAHEAFHVAEVILEFAGIRYEVGVSNEAYAYLLDYILTQIYSELAKY